MTGLNEVAWMWIAGAFSALGCVGLLAGRMGQRSDLPALRSVALGFFTLTLILLAGVTARLVMAQHGHWILPGGTLMGMIVGSTMEFGPPRQMPWHG